MELTLRPGRHEIIEKQDPVHEWRMVRLARLGIPWPVAEAAAGCRLAPDGGAGTAGLPSWLTLRILRSWAAKTAAGSTGG